MSDDLGQSFDPGLGSRFRKSLSSPSGAGYLPGNSLQVLRLFLPSFIGGSPLAPTDLLRPRMGGYSPDSAVRAQTTGVPADTGPSQNVRGPSQPSLLGGGGTSPSSTGGSGRGGLFTPQTPATPPSVLQQPPDTGAGPETKAAPANPSIVFSTAPSEPAPTGGSVGTPTNGAVGGAGVGNGNNDGLLMMLDQILRGGGGGQRGL